MITLDTVELPNLTWVDPWATASVSTQTRRRLDGGIAIYPRALTGGRRITLLAPEDQPLTVAQADALATLAAVPGATYSLSMPLWDFSATVLFDWSDTPLALQLLIDYADPEPDDPVTGTILLMTV